MDLENIKIKGVKALWLMLGLVFISGLFLRYQGVYWPKDLHLDERKIGNWLAFAVEHKALDHGYPGGFFTLARPFHEARTIFSAVRDTWRDWLSGGAAPASGELDYVLFARELNVWFGALTCLLVYLLGRRVTGSAVGGLFAAALMAFARYHVEHSHYAETDVAMVMMLSLALWLWVCMIDGFKVLSERRTEQRRSYMWKYVLLFAFACFVSGFAAGVKYYLAVFLLFVPLCAYGLGMTVTSGLWRGAGLGTAFVFVGLPVFAAGFFIATPAALDVPWFLEEIKTGAAAVYQETEGILGPALADPTALAVTNINQLKEFGVTLGVAWLVLATAGFVLFCFGKRVKYWPVTLMFPVLYLYYFIFKSPWVRSQECMNMLPILCVAAAVTLVSVFESRAGKIRKLMIGFVSLLAGVALISAVFNSVRVSSVFGWADNRFLAADWIKRHAPETEKYAAEIYTQPASRVFDSFRIYKIESSGLNRIVAHGCNYVFRNMDMRGRGIFDPRTGERFPECRHRFDEFSASTTLLREWSLPPSSTVPPVFVGNGIQLFGIGRSISTNIFESALARPMLVSEENRGSFFPVGHLLGSAAGVSVGESPETVAIGGQQLPDTPVYAVFSTDDTPVVIKLAGFGKRRILKLGPYDVQVVCLARSRFVPRLSEFEKITVRAQPIYGGYPACLMRLAFDVSEAAMFCAQLGHSEQALELLEESGADSVSESDAFLYAVQSGAYDRAEYYAESAMMEIERLRLAVSKDPDAVNYAGVSGSFYDRFSRLRMRDNNEVFMVRTSFSDEANRQEASFSPKVIVAGGLSVLVEFDLRVESLRGYPLKGDETISVLDPAGKEDVGYSVSELTDFKRVSVFVKGDMETRPLIRLVSDTPFVARYKNITLKWSLFEALTARENELAEAMAKYREPENR